MNLTLKHWIRFTGIAVTVMLVACTIFGVSDWREMAAHFAMSFAGALVGHWLATLAGKGD